VAWHPGVPSVGASGAIFGLAGALIAAFQLGEFSVPRAALSGTLRSLAMFVIYNLIFGAAIGTTDNAAHVGGLVTGLIVGALIAWIAPQQEHAPRRLLVFAALFSLLALGAVQLTHYHHLPLRFGRSPFESQARSNRLGEGLTLSSHLDSLYFPVPADPVVVLEDDDFFSSQAAIPGLLTPTFCSRQPTSNEVPKRNRRSPGAFVTR